jgi:predicted NUDIX family phosphoesterase
MTEANNVHPSEVGLTTPPELSKKEKAKLANILGFFRDAAEAVFPVQGFEVMTDPSRNVLLERMEALKPGTLVAQRARLEADPYFRHPIPYILIHRQRADGSIEFFVYQRTKLIGEDLLGQKFSLALGGHPEVPCIRFDADAAFDVEQSLLACLVQELDEEASFNGKTFTDYTEGGGLYTFAHDGFIRDDSDKVGLQHIGIVYAIGLPADVEVVCIEEELITVGFRTLEELSLDLELPLENSTYDFENWSRLVIHSYVDRIERVKAAEAVDALFLAEEGMVGGAEPIIPEGTVTTYLPPVGDAPVAERGEAQHFVHLDEVPFYPADDSAPVPLGLGSADGGQSMPLGLAIAGNGGVMDCFAKEVLEQVDRPLSAGPNGDWKPYDPAPVDPSAETKVLTELHREVGTTDDQMKVAVDELTRISDSVQPTEAERLSDLAS